MHCFDHRVHRSRVEADLQRCAGLKARGVPDRPSLMQGHRVAPPKHGDRRQGLEASRCRLEVGAPSGFPARPRALQFLRPLRHTLPSLLQLTAGVTEHQPLESLPTHPERPLHGEAHAFVEFVERKLAA